VTRRGAFDLSRFREAIAGPGIDPRCWIAIGRVDEDPDATVWDDILGWLCDVTAVSGPFAGSLLPLACRVTSDAQGVDVGHHRPPRQGGLVVVLFPSGDPNEDSVIIGQLHNTDDAGAPAEVNGDTIDEAFAMVTHIMVAPDEDLDEEWRNFRVTADSMVFGTADADQPFVRGDDLADALADLSDALGEFAAAIAVAPVNLGTATVALDPITLTQFQVALVQFKAASQTYLSTRINGD